MIEFILKLMETIFPWLLWYHTLLATYSFFISVVDYSSYVFFFIISVSNDKVISSSPSTQFIWVMSDISVASMSFLNLWCLNLYAKSRYLSKLQTEEVKNIPPQTLSLWHIDYFELKAIEKQQMKKGFLMPPFLSKSRS